MAKTPIFRGEPSPHRVGASKKLENGLAGKGERYSVLSAGPEEEVVVSEKSFCFLLLTSNREEDIHLYLVLPVPGNLRPVFSFWVDQLWVYRPLALGKP